MAVGVAADYTYSTTTQYDTSDSSKIIVTSKVEGVEAGDQLTYLAHREGDAIDDTTVIYADQVVATGSSHTFEYVAKVATDVNAQVLYGGKTAAGKAMAVDNTNTIPGLIEVKINGTANGQHVNAVGDFVEIYTAISPIESVKVGDADCVWFSSANGFWVETSAFADAEEAIDFTVTEGAAVAASVSVAKAVYADDNKTILALARATGCADYGVIISSDGSWDAAVEYVDGAEAAATVKYEALGSNDEGDFIIEVNSDVAFANGYQVKAYGDSSVSDAIEVE